MTNHHPEMTNAVALDGKFSERNDTPVNTGGLVCDKILQEILLMFLDLGLTPHEMRKVSGLSSKAINNGLKRLDGPLSHADLVSANRYRFVVQ